MTLVSTVAALIAALATAHAGDTIQLAPGNYVRPVLHPAFTQSVTITSQDPVHPAVLTDLVVSGYGLTFANLELSSIGGADAYWAFRVSNAHDIVFSHVEAHGDPTKPPGAQPNGFLLTDSQRVTVEDSDIHDLNAAITANRVDTLTVARNALHHLSKGGVELAQVPNSQIMDNVIGEFATSPGVHADGIQHYTTGTSAPTHDLTIARNLIYRGGGTVPMAILLDDETGKLPLSNVTIADNVAIGAQWQAISLNHATGGATITGNVVASWDGPAFTDNATPTPYRSWIMAGGAQLQLVESGNAAQLYMNAASGKAEAAPAGNTTLPVLTDGGLALIEAWALKHLGGAAAGIVP